MSDRPEIRYTVTALTGEMEPKPIPGWGPNAPGLNYPIRIHADGTIETPYSSIKPTRYTT
jgi:hypothetical protein